ncbi:hypothetical protein BGM26_20000 [Bacillus sp. FJAT-29790]|uniref:hypothetical protein n=1 Tax=Bacillus sp. FJAT-29790 TaxID=1895002 RepID=UPI001C24DBA7|nr:hypothetical protein [Bacillus sp. FJAT-29790]MBU8881211.1 hypothetical protein [Bacillus sp. FJAT-29790]
MEKILNEILEQVKGHSKRFDAIDERFDKVDERFDGIEKELNEVKGRLGNVENRLESVEGRLENVENRLENVEGRLENVEDSVHKLEDAAKNNATEFRSHLRQLEIFLDKDKETFRVISSELEGNKIDIKHLSEKSGVHDTEINQLKKRIHV